MKRSLCVALLLVLALPAPAQAPLSDSAPAETVLYVGWSGVSAVEADYQASTLKQVVDLFEPEQVSRAWARWRELGLDRVDDADFEEGLGVVEGLWAVSFRGPFAAWAALGDTSELGEGEADDVFYGALCWQPHDAADRAALVGALRRLLKEVPAAPVALDAGPEGPVRLRIGSAANRAAMAARPGPGIAAHPRFAAALGEVGPAALTAWVDLETPAAVFMDLLRAEGDAPEAFFAVMDVLHLAGLRQVAVAAGYDGPGWGTRVFVDAPAPRRGLAALLDAPPITDRDLAAVPQAAPVVGAWAFDPAALLALTRKGLRAADADVAQQFEDGLAQANQMLGVDVEADLVGGLGTTHVVFQDPAVAGASPLSLRAINRLQNPEGFARALQAVQNLANGLVAANTADAPISVQVHTVQRDGVTLNTLALPGLAPTWAVFDGHLHVGLYPQSVLAAADQRGAAGGSILDHPGFAAVRAAAGTHPVAGLSFVDVPVTAPASYGNLILVEHVATGLGAMALRDPFPAVLPPFGRLEPLLAPVTAVSWATEAGYHSAGRSPFVGASMLAGQGGGGAMQLLPMVWGGVAGAYESTQAARAVGVAAPAVGVADDAGMNMDWQDPDIHAMRQIGLAMQIYAAEHTARPSSAAQLLPYLDGDANVFASAFGGQMLGLTADNVDTLSDFVLLPGPPINEIDQPGRAPLVIRNPAAVPVGAEAPLPVVYADGHVEMVASLEVLAAQYRAATGLSLDEVLAAAAAR